MGLRMKNKQFWLAIWILGMFLVVSAYSEEPTTPVLHSSELEIDSYSNLDQDKTRQLVQGQYFGRFRLRYSENEYLDTRFQLQNFFQDPSGSTFLWETHKGTYNALSGYWIFVPNLRQCWQAYKTNGPLSFWNWDGQARGDPEDDELFVFERIDANHVRVKNIYGRYVRYVSPFFRCDGDVNQAAPFVPSFQ